MTEQEQAREVLFTVTQEQARQIAGVASASTTDDTRPTLQYMHVEWDQYYEGDEAKGWEIRFICTDSYMLAIRTLRPEIFEATEAGTIDIADARAFAGHLKSVASKAKAITDSVIFRFELPDENPARRRRENPGLVEFGRLLAPEEGISVGLGESDFPNWKTLVPEPGARHDESKLWAFNPVYMTRLMSAIGTTKAIQGQRPIQLWSTEGDNLKPIGFSITHHGNETFTGLLMPVRV